MRTSYSALQTYKQCPQKYKFQEIDKIPSAKSKEAVFGTLIHGILKFMFEKDPLFPTLDQVMDFYRNKFVELPSDTFENEEVSKIYFEEGLKMLRNFYIKNSPWNFSVLELESRFEVPIEDKKNNAVHILSGKIDRVDKLNDDSYEIIDYKTAKRLPSQKSVDEDLQLSLYALGIQKKWPHLRPERIKASLYFLKHGEKLSSSRIVESIEKVQNEILSLIAQIRKKLEKNDKFEPLPSPLCDYCPYKKICPAWKHLYDKIRNPKSEIRKDEIESIIKEYFELKKNVNQDETRLDELQRIIKDYMEQENLMRVFGDDGYISKSIQTRSKYNFDAIKKILEPIGKWQEILDADEKKLKELMKKLPEDVRQKITELGIETKEFNVLKISFKKQQV